MKPLVYLGLVLWIALSGCLHIETKKLPTFGLASSMPGPERPRLIYEEEILDPGALPDISPFAVVLATGDLSRETLARRVWHEGQKLKADIVIASDRGIVPAGVLVQYWGFGIATGHPLFTWTVQGFCFRVNPARLRIHYDHENTVLALDDSVRKSGILEGDRLISIDGMPWHTPTKEPMQQANHWAKLLTAKPGQQVTLVWIRPGMGRMEGRAECLENPPTHINLKDSIPWKPPPPPDNFRNYR